MKSLTIGLILSFSWIWVAAQSESEDTTIYQVVEQAAMLSPCADTALAQEERAQCAQQLLLQFIYQNVTYPLLASQGGHEGTVVVRFVIEKDGSLSGKEILRNVEGGCGEEVLRVLGLFESAGIRWIPAVNRGEVVRSSITLPVKFKLEEAPPYELRAGDTVYTTFDSPLDFEGGAEGLTQFLDEQLVYPTTADESCKVGKIDIEIIVEPSGNVRVLDLVDYSNLGLDFWNAGIQTVTNTYGKWTPATYEGRKVPSSLTLSLQFRPDYIYCNAVNEGYAIASNWAVEAASLLEAGEIDNALLKIDSALVEFPENAEFLIFRGQIMLDQNRFQEACEDLSKAKEIAMVNWYDDVLSIICKQ
jgi:hypothetical protein